MERERVLEVGGALTGTGQPQCRWCSSTIRPGALSQKNYCSPFLDHAATEAPTMPRSVSPTVEPGLLEHEDDSQSGERSRIDRATGRQAFV